MGIGRVGSILVDIWQSRGRGRVGLSNTKSQVFACSRQEMIRIEGIQLYIPSIGLHCIQPLAVFDRPTAPHAAYTVLFLSFSRFSSFSILPPSFLSLFLSSSTRLLGGKHMDDDRKLRIFVAERTLGEKRWKRQEMYVS